MDMKKILITLSVLALSTGAVHAASAVNKDSEVHTLVVTEGSNRTELVIAAGETVDFCQEGCFVTMPNGDREALTGSETVEIVGGKGRISQ